MVIQMSPSTTQTLKFRPMKLEDIPRIHEIDVLSFTLPWPEKSYHFELTQNPATQALVAELVTPEEKGLVIGMTIVWMVIDEAHIATIAIHPDFRGLGLGKRLLAEILRQSLQRGANSVTLEVRAGNSVARDMYMKFGFRVVGRRLRYYKDNNEDAILMTMDKPGWEYLKWLDQLAVKIDANRI